MKNLAHDPCFRIIILCSVFLFSNCKKETVQLAPVASFIADKITAEINEVVTFTNQSENANRYSWNFGDNNTSTEASPNHSYRETGTFSVTLTAIGEGGEATTSKSIIVSNPLPIANFSMDKSEAEIGELITFTNQSDYADSFEWDFGDGNKSTEENPTHSYSNNGDYTIQLKATGDGGINQVAKTITITAMALSGKWKGSTADAKLSMSYDLSETDGKISGFITVFRIQPGSISNLPYATSGTFNKDTNEVEFKTTSGFNFKYEYTGQYDGGSNIIGKIKATNLAEVELNLERE